MGRRRGRHLDRKMGVRGVDTGELLLHDVRVPAANVWARSAASGWPCSGSTRCARSWRPAGSGWPRARSCTPPSTCKSGPRSTSTDRRLPGHPVGDRQAGHRDRGRPPADLPRRVAGRPGQVHQGVGALPVDEQVLRHRAGGEGVGRVPAAARRGRLHEGPPDRALLPRRQAAHDRRGHQSRCSSA